MNIDIVSILDKYGVPLVILGFIAYCIKKALDALLPPLVNAIIERVKAGTEMTKETQKVVQALPETMAESTKATVSAISSFEKALVLVEKRLGDAFKETIGALRDDLNDRRTEQIQRDLVSLKRRSSIPDTDPPPSTKVSSQRPTPDVTIHQE